MTVLHAEWLHAETTRKVLDAFAAAHMPLRFVGGCVRDGLLARAVKDIDFATPATPDQVMALLENAGIKAVPTGLQHGTITAVVEGQHFEITTLRRDVSCDGRHAEVEFTADWKEDASRRDFTMNALYAEADGKLHDYFGGIEDARAGHLRFIGRAEDRIREDGLRILRFFRFFAHYGKGEMDKDALAACAAAKEMIDALSGERIALEMFKLLTAAQAPAVLERMQDAGILVHAIPSKVETKSLSVYLMSCGRADAVISLALLLRSTSHAMELLESIRERWKLSNAKFYRLKKLASHPTQQIAYLTLRKQKARIRKEGREAVMDEIRCVWAELAVNRHDPDMDEYFAEFLALAESWEIPVFPVTGNDLLAAGVKEGRALGVALAEMESYWEEQEYRPGKEELLARLK